jgi:hypothetical protein
MVTSKRNNNASGHQAVKIEGNFLPPLSIDLHIHIMIVGVRMYSRRQHAYMHIYEEETPIVLYKHAVLNTRIMQHLTSR